MGTGVGLTPCTLRDRHHFAHVTALKAAAASGNDDVPLMLAMKTAIKLGDVAHTAKAPALHRQWTERIMEEFFAQGDEERARGMEVSPFMDRHTVSIGECQVRGGQRESDRRWGECPHELTAFGVLPLRVSPIRRASWT